MPDAKTRAWVERILQGDFRPDDLSNVFMYTRDHCDGREEVQEIGHFVAHHHERDKGITTRRTREWFAVVRFHAPYLGPNAAKLIDVARLPSVAPDYLRAAALRIGSKAIRDQTGLNCAAAHKMLIAFANKLQQNSDGTYRFPPSITTKEFELFQCAATTLTVKPAFDGTLLFEQFCAALKSNGLISKDELRLHDARLRILVQLFAVAAMHNCMVKIDDNRTTQLKASPAGKQLYVSAGIPIEDGHSVHLASAMFVADLDPIDHCDANLLAAQSWDFEIELGTNERLSRLG